MQTPDIDQKISLISQDRQMLQQTMGAVVVNNEETKETASKMLTVVTGRLKRVKEIQKEMTQPLKDHVKLIDSKFKTELDELTAITEYLRVQISKYMTEQQRLAEIEAKRQAELFAIQQAEQEAKLKALAEEEAKAQQMLAGAKTEEERVRAMDEIVKTAEQKVLTESEITAVFVTAPQHKTTSSTGTVSGKVTWKAEVVDIAMAYAKNPHLFDLVPKKSALNEYAKSIAEEKYIDGIQIIREVTPIVRTA